tara:strand:- start:543 stop:1238 length:696 start_codon:yes stop_codon:yes gene_type:complete
VPVNGSGRLIGPGHPIRDGLILWYDSRFKEPQLDSGEDWFDISGRGQDASVEGNPTWDFGHYFQLDGTDDYFQLTNGVGGTQTSWSIEFWGHRDAANTNTGYMLDGRNAGASSDSTNWWFATELSGADTNSKQGAGIEWSNGYTNWHQACITDNNSTNVSTLYINGQSEDTSTSGTWNSNDLTIGARMNGNNEWVGAIGCVRVYNRALTATEIRHNFLADAAKFLVTQEGA